MALACLSPLRVSSEQLARRAARVARCSIVVACVALVPIVGTAAAATSASSDGGSSGSGAQAEGAPLVRGMVVYGDSIAMIGYDTAMPVQWDQLHQNLGLSVGYVNDGRAGTTTSEAAVRMGALDLDLSANSSAVGSTPVTVAPITTGTWRDRVVAWDGVLTNGTGRTLAGTLSHDKGTNGGAPVWTFTRASGTASYALTGPVTFHCNSNDSRRNWVAMLEGGTNNYGGPVPDTNYSFARRDMDLMANYAGSEYFIVGLHIRPNDDRERAAEKASYNASMLSRYPDRYVDVNAYTDANGLAQAGITPTAADIRDIKAGRMPTSLMNPDLTHPNPTGLLIWRRALEQFIRVHIPTIPAGGAPVVRPAAPNAAVAATDRTGVTVTWGAVAGAIGYKTEYRKSGTTAWQLSVHTNGTSAEVTDVVSGSLSAGTTYDIRVTAVNEAGGGPSTLLTAATAA